MKINSFFEKNIEKIFLLYVYIQPFIDVITAIMLNVFKIEFTLGVIFRFIFLMFMIYYLIFVNKNKSKKKSIIYLAIILIYFIFYNINILVTKDINALSFEFKNLIKTFYFPIVLICIYELFIENGSKVTTKLLTKLFIIYSSLILIPNILNIGFKSYEITKSGSIGLFYTANEVGAIISILLPIFLYQIFNKKNILLNIIIFILLTYLLTSIGTKGPLLSLLIVTIYHMVNYIRKCIKRKLYISLSIFSIAILVAVTSFILILPKTNFYKNIKTHLEFLEIKEAKDLLEFKKIDHFIFSERLSFWTKTNIIYTNSNISSKLLGIGYIDNYSTDEVSMKMIEMDFIDIFYRHGIIGFIIYFSIPFIYIIKLIKKYISDKKNLDRKIASTYLLSIILSLVLSLLTGHVITSPSVSIFVALIINLFYNEISKGDNILWQN